MLESPWSSFIASATTCENWKAEFIQITLLTWTNINQCWRVWWNPNVWWNHMCKCSVWVWCNLTGNSTGHILCLCTSTLSQSYNARHIFCQCTLSSVFTVAILQCTTYILSVQFNINKRVTSHNTKTKIYEHQLTNARFFFFLRISISSSFIILLKGYL